MAEITLRDGLGRLLTSGEVDSNFSNLNTELARAEADFYGDDDPTTIVGVTVGPGFRWAHAFAGVRKVRNAQNNGWIPTELLFAPVSPVGSFKNKIINGGFDFWHRGTSQTISGYGSADRWSFSNTGNGARTVSVINLYNSSGGRFLSGAHTNITQAPTVANAVIAQSQYIEYARTLAGKRATLSFFAESSPSREIAVEMVQMFGTGGSPSPLVSIPLGRVALSDSLERYEITLDIPPVVGKTFGTNSNDYLGLIFWQSAGSDYATRASGLGNQAGAFNITGVQIEEGPYATPFEQRPVGIEMLLSQRYYFADENINLEGRAYDAATGFNIMYTFPARMRVPPACTATKTGGGADITVSFAPSATTSRHTTIKATRSGSDQVYGSCSITADAEI